MAEIRGHMLLGNSLMVRLGHHVARTRYGTTLRWERNENGKGILGFSVSGAKILNQLKIVRRRKEELRGKKVILLTGTNDVMTNNRYKWMYLKFTNVVKFLGSIDCEVVLMTLPPIPVLSEEDERTGLLMKFNELIRHTAENKKLRLIDSYQLFMDGPVINQTLFEKFYYNKRTDKLHWNREGMEKVVRTIETEL